MDEFLRSRKSTLQHGEPEQPSVVHVVIGNESCDLDSAVSAIAYAYLLHTNKYASRKDSIVLPVLNTRRAELKLKSEVLFWLRETLRLDLDWIVCKDEIDLPALRRQNKTLLLTLVDHNESSEYEPLANLVEIIDHHKNLLDRSNVKLEIHAKVGSCCSLLARRYLNFCEENGVPVDEQIALLLYGPIILDTICFSESAQRFNELDTKIAEKLESYLQTAPVTRTEVYAKLIQAKNSVDAFSFEELLAKDLKLVPVADDKQIAVPSFSGVLAAQVLARDSFRQQLPPVAAKSNYLAIVMMGIDNTQVDRIERDLAVYSSSAQISRKIAQSLISANGGELQLETVRKDDHLCLFRQGNVQASRKLILPIIYDLVASDDFTRICQEDIKLQTPNGSRAGSVPSTKVSPAQVENGTEKRMIEKGKPSTSQLGSPVKSGHSMPPESINYYESYFEDSFVGDFSGQVDEAQLGEKELDQMHDLAWQDDDKMNNALEFGFDSFGPESILFHGLSDRNSNDAASPKKLDAGQAAQDANDKPKEEAESSAANGIGPRAESEGEQTAEASGRTQMINVSSLPDFELVSLSIVEPQLKAKLNSCFDEDKIKNGYEIADNHAPPPSILFVEKRQSDVGAADPEELAEKDSMQPAPFKRGGTLTQSQRRKVSPKFKFEEILNTSDDVTLTAGSGGDGSSLPTANGAYPEQKPAFYGDGVLYPAPARAEVAPSRTGTLKKKIVADFKDINFDLESPEVDTRRVTFAGGEQAPAPSAEALAEPLDDELPDWRASCPIGIDGEVKKIDMKVIEPYKKVLSHAGYFQSSTKNDALSDESGEPNPAIIIFSACYLPDRSRRDYEYVMENLFMYVLTTLHELIADDYILVYFHNAPTGGSSANNMPTFNWLKRCYYMIDRKLRKNLKTLYLVHPTFWLKTLVIMTKPFINSKFTRKLRFVNSLNELDTLVPIDRSILPEPVKQVELLIELKQKRKMTK